MLEEIVKVPQTSAERFTERIVHQLVDQARAPKLEALVEVVQIAAQRVFERIVHQIIDVPRPRVWNNFVITQQRRFAERIVERIVERIIPSRLAKQSSRTHTWCTTASVL